VQPEELQSVVTGIVIFALQSGSCSLGLWASSLPKTGTGRTLKDYWKYIGCRNIGGARGSVVVRHYATSRKVAGSIPDEVNF
jgi:hypothetical protein